MTKTDTTKPLLDITKPMQNHLGAKIVHAEPTENGYFVTCRHDNGMTGGYHTDKKGGTALWPSSLDVFNVPEPPKKMVVWKSEKHGGYLVLEEPKTPQKNKNKWFVAHVYTEDPNGHA